MNRTVWLALVAAGCSLAQTDRDAYRSAYQAWRQGDPGLERDASNPGATLAQRADRAGAAAAKYSAARTAFLEALAASSPQTLAGLESAAPADLAPPSPAGLDQYLAAQSAAVGRTSDAFANDQDRGIQQVRQALERERAALAALTSAVANREQASEAVKTATAAADTARLKALDQDRQVGADLKQITDLITRESGAWNEYYSTLSRRALESAGPAETAAANPGGGPRIVDPAPRPAAASITPVPLVRYTGAWTYPPANGLYHGPQPESIDLAVNEDHGKASGTLFARFKLPPGSTGDPEVRFDFSGEFKNARTQVFDIQTPDGGKGTLELIPGPAFNLLEINFQTDPKPGKVRQGNAVLVKR